MNRVTVVNKDNEEYYDVYIGRGTKWGNPFIIGRDGNREQVVAKYKVWLYGHPGLKRSLKELKGKTLGCHCKPEICHGDIIAEAVNERYGNN